LLHLISLPHRPPSIKENVVISYLEINVTLQVLQSSQIAFNRLLL
jgi:hypothetical protein